MTLEQLSQISCTKVSSLQVSCQLLLTHDSLVLHLLQQQIRKTMKVVPKQPVVTSGSLRLFCPQKQNLERNFSAKLYSAQ